MDSIRHVSPTGPNNFESVPPKKLCATSGSTGTRSRAQVAINCRVPVSHDSVKGFVRRSPRLLPLWWRGRSVHRTPFGEARFDASQHCGSDRQPDDSQLAAESLCTGWDVKDGGCPSGASRIAAISEAGRCALPIRGRSHPILRLAGISHSLGETGLSPMNTFRAKTANYLRKCALCDRILAFTNGFRVLKAVGAHHVSAS